MVLRRNRLFRLIALSLIVLALFVGALHVASGSIDAIAGAIWDDRGTGRAQAVAPTATIEPGVVVIHYHADATPAALAAAPTTMVLDAAQGIVRAEGYTGTPSAAAWCAACPLHVIAAARTDSPDGYDQRAFFFTDHYLGTDTLAPSASVAFVSRTVDTVALRYTLYNAADGTCCPTAGTADVRYHWDGARLAPLDPIPDNRYPPAPTGLAASECAWAVATLREDARLDIADIQTNPASRDWFTTTAGWWTQIADWISASCAPPWPAQQCATSTSHLSTGRSSHMADEQLQQPFAPRAWDDTWIANYDRLLALVGRLCA